MAEGRLGAEWQSYFSETLSVATLLNSLILMLKQVHSKSELKQIAPPHKGAISSIIFIVQWWASHCSGSGPSALSWTIVPPHVPWATSGQEESRGGQESGLYCRRLVRVVCEVLVLERSCIWSLSRLEKLTAAALRGELCLGCRLWDHIYISCVVFLAACSPWRYARSINSENLKPVSLEPDSEIDVWSFDSKSCVKCGALTYYHTAHVYSKATVWWQKIMAGSVSPENAFYSERCGDKWVIWIASRLWILFSPTSRGAAALIWTK